MKSFGSEASDITILFADTSSFTIVICISVSTICYTASAGNNNYDHSYPLNDYLIVILLSCEVRKAYTFLVMVVWKCRHTHTQLWLCILLFLYRISHSFISYPLPLKVRLYVVCNLIQYANWAYYGFSVCNILWYAFAQFYSSNAFVQEALMTKCNQRNIGSKTQQWYSDELTRD